jgi:hypothetical protein
VSYEKLFNIRIIFYLLFLKIFLEVGIEIIEIGRYLSTKEPLLKIGEIKPVFQIVGNILYN